MGIYPSGIALLWDAAPLWGLLAFRALRELDVPCLLLNPQEIAQGGLSDKRLLLVPGGSARHKYTALGPRGIEAVREFVAHGGHYLGFCGGAGLGLTGEYGLGLCPWRRAEFQDRLHHLLSGHVRVRFATGATGGEATDGKDATDWSPGVAAGVIPVWWPGRFQPDAENDNIHVLARYDTRETVSEEHTENAEHVETFPPDLLVADLPLCSIPPEVLADWNAAGMELPPHIHGAPCVVRGAFGAGTYILSYSHLETPDSPAANAWLARLLERCTGISITKNRIAPWEPAACTRWNDPVLLACREGMHSLLALGTEHGLLFPRTPWLTGWRTGTPGSGLNTLYLTLCALTEYAPSESVKQRWLAHREAFQERFALFRQGAVWCLLTQRLSGTLSASETGAHFAERVRKTRMALFGTPMRGGGLYQELLDTLEPVLLSALREQAETPA